MLLFVFSVYFVIQTVHASGYQNFTDYIEYSELDVEYTATSQNNDLSVESVKLSSNSGFTIRDGITACVANCSKTVVETTLESISDEMINREIRRSGVTNILTFVTDTLRENNAYYDMAKQFYAKSEDIFDFTLDPSSRVVHRSWAINTDSTTGTWHVFVYPAMAPNDVCVEPVQSGQTGSATDRHISNVHVILLACCLGVISRYI